MADPTVPPELASILATLAQFAPQQQDQQHSTPTPPPPAANPTITDPRLQGRRQPQTSHPDYSPAIVENRDNFHQNDHQPSNSYNPKAAVFHPVKPQGRTTPQQQEQTIIDPATITEWSAGLRCVTKIAAQTPLFAEKIRGLINDQRRNEMQWYSSRQTLKQMQAKRSAGANEIHSILKSVGGNNTPSQPQQTPEEKEAELAAFDRKLYKAQIDMNESMSNVLKSLGVPFFGTHSYLILPDDSNVDTKSLDVQGERPKWSPRVTSRELLELKRKMITHLEDMYKA